MQIILLNVQVIFPLGSIKKEILNLKLTLIFFTACPIAGQIPDANNAGQCIGNAFGFNKLNS